MNETVCPRCKSTVAYDRIGGVSRAECSVCQRPPAGQAGMQIAGAIAVITLTGAAILVLSCARPDVQTAGPEYPSRFQAIGINGHLDKTTGEWTPGYGYLDAFDDSVCCWWTMADAQRAADSAAFEWRAGK